MKFPELDRYEIGFYLTVSVIILACLGILGVPVYIGWHDAVHGDELKSLLAEGILDHTSYLEGGGNPKTIIWFNDGTNYVLWGHYHMKFPPGTSIEVWKRKDGRIRILSKEDKG